MTYPSIPLFLSIPFNNSSQWTLNILMAARVMGAQFVICMAVTALSNYGPISWFLRWMHSKIGFSHRLCISKKLQLASYPQCKHKAESKRYLSTSTFQTNYWFPYGSKIDSLHRLKQPIQHTHTTEIGNHFHAQACFTQKLSCISLKHQHERLHLLGLLILPFHYYSPVKCLDKIIIMVKLM